MLKSCWTGAVIAVLLVLGGARPALAYDDVMGPTDLTRYCRAAFGNAYAPVQVAAGREGWRCRNAAGETRSMDIQDACERQWNTSRDRIKAIYDGRAWVCAFIFIERPVNLDTYCKGHFGGQYQAVLHGGASTDWSCQRGTNQSDRKPISVTTACKEQWPFNQVIRSRAVPPTGWSCLMVSAKP